MTYYVRKGGSDSNTGLSSGAAFLTLNRAKSAAVAAGDIVDVGAGSWHEKLDIETGGTSGSPIIWRGVQGSTFIDGLYALPSGNAAAHPVEDPRNQEFVYTPLVHIEASYVTWDGIDVINSRGRGIMVGIGPAKQYDIYGITIQNCNVEGARYHAIRCWYVNTLTISNVQCINWGTYVPFDRSDQNDFVQGLSAYKSKYVTYEDILLEDGYGEACGLAATDYFKVRRMKVNRCIAINGPYFNHAKRGVCYDIMCSHDGTSRTRAGSRPDGAVFNNEANNQYRTSPDTSQIIGWNWLLVGNGVNLAFYNKTDDDQTNPPIGDGSYSDVYLFNITSVNATENGMTAGSKPTYSNVKLRNVVCHQTDTSIKVANFSEATVSGKFEPDYFRTNIASNEDLGSNSTVGNVDIANPDANYDLSIPDPVHYMKGADSIAIDNGETPDLSSYSFLSDSFFSDVPNPVTDDYFGNTVGTWDCGFDDYQDGTTGGGSTSGTITTQVASGTEDMHERGSDGNVLNEAVSLWVRNNTTASAQRTMGLRFVLDIPQGATVDTAYLQLYAKSGSYKYLKCTVTAADEDDAAAMVTGATSDISGRTDTTASVSIDDEPGSTGWYDTAELKTIVQEIVDRPGFSSGNNILFILTPTNTGSERFYTYPYEDEPTLSAKLYAEYTVSGGDTNTLGTATATASGTGFSTSTITPFTLGTATATATATGFNTDTTNLNSGPYGTATATASATGFSHKLSPVASITLTCAAALVSFVLDDDEMNREVIEGPTEQSPNAKIVYGMDVTKLGTEPTDVYTTVYDITDRGNPIDVTSSVTDGTALVSGNVISTPTIRTLTAGKWYKANVLFTVSEGNTFERFFRIKCEA